MRPGLLRIDQIHIQIARVPDGLLHGVFGQLVEGDALRLFRIQPEYGGEMPAYGLALAVGVGRQKDLGGVFGFLFQGVYQLALPADVDVFRLKIMLDVDAELAFGQIPDMSLGGNHLVALSEKALDGGHLRGRLHDNECCRAHRNASYLSVRRIAGFVHIYNLFYNRVSGFEIFSALGGPNILLNFQIGQKRHHL